MSKTICSKCRFAIQDVLEMFCLFRKLHTEDGLFVNCHCFRPKTVFDRITASPEVLAEKLVYPTYGMISRTWDFEKDDWGTAEPSWSSSVTPSDLYYSTKEEAIAATVARLKEVGE